MEAALKQLRNIHDACRIDAGAVTDMTQIASGSFNDEKQHICNLLNIVFTEIHSVCQWSGIFSQKGYIYSDSAISLDR